MADLIFVALAFLAISGAIAMLVYKNPMYSALGILITMLSIAGMFALLNATFLFLVQLIVYAGALGIQLGSDEYYGGQLVRKPVIGRNLKPCEPNDIFWANQLLLGTSFYAMLFTAVIRTALFFLI